jgi:tRNA dimethylallyltransferase
VSDCGTSRELAADAATDVGPGVVIGLLGPTGVGKTAVALELAQLLGTRIISCDSMQLYRGFRVLANQPSAEEARSVSHALVGCVEPGEAFSAAEYAALVRPLIGQDLADRGWALVVGGTGLYMRAALAPLAVAVDGDPVLRARLEARAAAEGPGTLHGELARLDPDAARAIDSRNVRRVVRALEAVTATGKAWSGRNDLWVPDYDHPTLVVCLVVERAELYRRIAARAVRIVHGGAVEEVRRFRQERGLEASEPGGAGIRSAIGYPEICRYLDGQQTLDETVDQVAAATRRYARRQLTWLRKLGDAVIIDVRDRGAEEVARDILALAFSKVCPKEPRYT